MELNIIQTHRGPNQRSNPRTVQWRPPQQQPPPLNGLLTSQWLMNTKTLWVDRWGTDQQNSQESFLVNPLSFSLYPPPFSVRQHRKPGNQVIYPFHTLAPISVNNNLILWFIYKYHYLLITVPVIKLTKGANTLPSFHCSFSLSNPFHSSAVKDILWQNPRRRRIKRDALLVGKNSYTFCVLFVTTFASNVFLLSFFSPPHFLWELFHTWNTLIAKVLFWRIQRELIILPMTKDLEYGW